MILITRNLGGGDLTRLPNITVIINKHSWNFISEYNPRLVIIQRDVWPSDRNDSWDDHMSHLPSYALVLVWQLRFSQPKELWDGEQTLDCGLQWFHPFNWKGYSSDDALHVHAVGESTRTLTNNNSNPNWSSTAKCLIWVTPLGIQLKCKEEK